MQTVRNTRKGLLTLGLGSVLSIFLLGTASPQVLAADPPARKPVLTAPDSDLTMRLLTAAEAPLEDKIIPPPGRKPAYKGSLALTETPTEEIASVEEPAVMETAHIPLPPRRPERAEPVVAAIAAPEAPPAIVPAVVDKAEQSSSDINKVYKTTRKRSAAEKESVARLSRLIRQDVGDGSPSRALKRLEKDQAVKYLDGVEFDQLRTHVARGFLQAGKVVQAYELASVAAQRSGHFVPQAGWIGGLAAWRMGKYDAATPLFESAATSPYASSWQKSAGAYWASRCHMRERNASEVADWLKLAAAHPRTFYGLIATRALGRDFDFNWKIPAYSNAHKERLMKDSAARQALALAESGELRKAEKVLAKLAATKDPALQEALIAFAAKREMPGLAMKLAEQAATEKGNLYDAALYPLSPWKPQGGYKIDRALVHAIIRQESRFNPAAESHQGARGLMQLMPTTASYVADNKHYKQKDGQATLHDPALNLSIGQRYIEKLLFQDHVEAELFSLVIAYNAGPGNLRRWKKDLADMKDDPLLFIESIPVGETRAYIERVMANYWIYRLRLNQPVPSLDAVAEGQWAQYVPLDGIKQAGFAPALDFQIADRGFFN